MNHQFIRHTLQEDLYGTKTRTEKDSLLMTLGGDRNTKNYESSYARLDSSKNNIDEILRCFICFGKVKDAHICPNCSKLCCASCIKKWLTEQKSQCPHCRCSLRVSQLVNCRFINELASAIEKSATTEEEIEVCSIHQAKMAYFCKTCKLAICADCAMFGTEHKGHEFDHLTKIYDNHVEMIKNESQSLQKRLKELSLNLNMLESTIEKLKKAKDDKVSELTLVLEQMHHRLDQELKSKLLSLIQQKTSMSDEIEFLESTQNELNRHISQSAKSHLISKSSELVKLLRDINSKPLSKFNNKPVSIEFTSEIIPQFDSGIFYLKPYSKLKQSQEIVYSDTLQSNGLQWKLKIYPNGNGVAKGAYLSVFLEMIKGVQESSKYEYKVEMINQKNSDVVAAREFTSEFESGECWGYNRFFKLDLLEKEGYLTETDTIVLKYYVRAPTYYQQCQDQKRYIQQLENAQKESDSLIEELKEKLKAEKVKNKKLREIKQVENSHNSTKKSGEVTEESKAPKPEDLKLNISEQFKLLKSDCKGNTNRKEGSSRFVAKEMNEDVHDCSLDAISTLKKEETVASKYYTSQEDQEKTDEDNRAEDAHEDELRKDSDSNHNRESECQNLFENFADPAEIYQPANNYPEQVLKTDQDEQSCHEEEKFQNEEGEEHSGAEDYLKENEDSEELDLDNICEKTTSEPCSRILADHDIDQIDIDKFLMDVSNKNSTKLEQEVKKNLLSNFDAESKRDKKLDEKFSQSIHQFSENLMKKIEGIKNTSNKFRRTDHSDDKRKPLTLSTKPNLLNDSNSEHDRRPRELSQKLLSVDQDNSSEYQSLF